MGVLDCGARPEPGCNAWRYNASSDAMKTALQTALDIENPRRQNPDTVDCASCHAAGPLRDRAENKGIAPMGLVRFTSSWPLGLINQHELKGDPRRVRAFGYFGDRPAFSQRTVNETAAVADAVNAMLR
jgi:hypothetical protein